MPAVSVVGQIDACTTRTDRGTRRLAGGKTRAPVLRSRRYLLPILPRHRPRRRVEQRFHGIVRSHHDERRNRPDRIRQVVLRHPDPPVHAPVRRIPRDPPRPWPDQLPRPLEQAHPDARGRPNPEGRETDAATARRLLAHGPRPDRGEAGGAGVPLPATQRRVLRTSGTVAALRRDGLASRRIDRHHTAPPHGGTLLAIRNGRGPSTR